jgi:hypothetical protein
LPLQWREWAIPLMRYGVRFIDIGHMGQSDATLLSHGDEDDRASERDRDLTAWLRMQSYANASLFGLLT